jgi:hypothetical protein
MLCLFFKKLTSKLLAKLLRIMNGRWVLDLWVFLIDRWLGGLTWRTYLKSLRVTEAFALLLCLAGW